MCADLAGKSGRSGGDPGGGGEPVNRTATSSVASRLRRDILSGRLPPGQKLRQDELAREFNISRIPVREALIALAGEGLVVLQANRGGVVAGLSRKELEEIYAIGRALEELAVERAIAQLTLADIGAMETILAEMERRRTSAARWYGLNQRFHMTLARACDWPTLTGLVERWREHMGRYVTGFGAFCHNRSLWDADHRAILEACRKRDTRRAVRLVREHWEKSFRIVEDRMPSADALASGPRRRGRVRGVPAV
jgi:DNA-binding GntR family transcriptional regulator